jgi:hypothetical protein
MEGTSQVFTSSNRSNTPMRELLRQQGWQLSGELDGLDAGDPEIFFFARRTEPMNWDTGGNRPSIRFGRGDETWFESPSVSGKLRFNGTSGQSIRSTCGS